MITDNIYKNFFNTIASSSSYEAYKKVDKINTPDLVSSVKNARFSDLGTPVIDYVELSFQIKNLLLTEKDGSRYIREGVPQAQVKQLETEMYKIRLDNVELSVNSVNNITRTSINGMNGTFKEFNSKGDYLISLSGSLIGANPFQNDIQNLNNFAKIELKNENLNIKSKFLNDTFNIFDVVLTDWTFTLSKQYNNVVDYTISLESDNDLEIIF